MHKNSLRRSLSVATILGVTALCALAWAKSGTMLDVDVQLDSNLSGSITGTVLLFKDANDKVIGTCAPDAAVSATNGHLSFDCPLSGNASSASAVKLVSDQHTEIFGSSLSGPTSIQLTNANHIVVGNLYAFDVDGSEPLF